MDGQGSIWRKLRRWDMRQKNSGQIQDDNNIKLCYDLKCQKVYNISSATDTSCREPLQEVVFWAD